MEKYKKELLDLYKRCIKTYLVSKGLKIGKRRKFDKLFNHYISYRNIEIYFNLPVNLLIQAMVKDTLKELVKGKEHVHRHSKKTVRRKK